MDSVNIYYHFENVDLAYLKAAAAQHLSDTRPTLRLELIARWSGFKTFAALQTALRQRTSISLALNPASARTFAMDKGIRFSAFALHATLAAAALKKTSDQHPELHVYGFGRHSIEIPHADLLRIRETLPKEEMRGAIAKERDERLAKGCADLTNDASLDMFLRALAFCSCLTRTKRVNPRQGSYRLKHHAERRSYSLQGEVNLSPGYVANGSLIAAAFYAGFSSDAIKRDRDRRNPNLCFNVSTRSVDAASLHRSVPA